MKLFIDSALIDEIEQAYSYGICDGVTTNPSLIAKEGAKFNISMVYATQSMSTLSPDLLKNTENFIVTHLDDDREVKELQHKRAFRDIAGDVERIQSKGYVQIKTLSLPIAIPVQIRLFNGNPTSR